MRRLSKSITWHALLDRAVKARDRIEMLDLACEASKRVKDAREIGWAGLAQSWRDDESLALRALAMLPAPTLTEVA